MLINNWNENETKAIGLHLLDWYSCFLWTGAASLVNTGQDTCYSGLVCAVRFEICSSGEPFPVNRAPDQRSKNLQRCQTPRLGFQDSWNFYVKSSTAIQNFTHKRIFHTSSCPHFIFISVRKNGTSSIRVFHVGTFCLFASIEHICTASNRPAVYLMFLPELRIKTLYSY